MPDRSVVLPQSRAFRPVATDRRRTSSLPSSGGSRASAPPGDGVRGRLPGRRARAL